MRRQIEEEEQTSLLVSHCDIILPMDEAVIVIAASTKGKEVLWREIEQEGLKKGRVKGSSTERD